MEKTATAKRIKPGRAAVILFAAVCAMLFLSAALAESGNPALSPLGTERIGEVWIEYGVAGHRKTVRQNPDTNSEAVTAVPPGQYYPCYAEEKGANGKTWYYIWVNENYTWGWVSSNLATLKKDDSPANGETGEENQPVSGQASPAGTSPIGEVKVNYGQRKTVRANPDTNAETVAVADPGSRYPCYDVRQGNTRKDWYYIRIEETDTWGWISSSVSSLARTQETAALPTEAPAGANTFANPAVSPLGSEQIGEVTIVEGKKKMVREAPNPESLLVAAVEPSSRYPCYAKQKGSTGRDWYYIWIEEEGEWGWISSILATFERVEAPAPTPVPEPTAVPAAEPTADPDDEPVG